MSNARDLKVMWHKKGKTGNTTQSQGRGAGNDFEGKRKPEMICLGLKTQERQSGETQTGSDR